MPHCFTDSTGKHHFGVTMKEIYHDFGVLNRTSNVTIPSRAWAYGPDCTETFSTRIFDYAKPDLSDVIVNSPEAIAAVKHNVPAPTFPVVSNEPLFVLFKNELPVRHLFQDWLDSVRSELHCGLMAPNCKPDSRTVIHFHGGHTLPQYGQGGEKRNTPHARYSAAAAHTGTRLIIDVRLLPCDFDLFFSSVLCQMVFLMPGSLRTAPLTSRRWIAFVTGGMVCESRVTPGKISSRESTTIR